jgi:hypothetical protein
MNDKLIRRSIQGLIWAGILVSGATGCDHDHDIVSTYSGVVGGACRGDYDCAERCVAEPEFPYGTCVLSCASDFNCPRYTLCIEKHGGICLSTCYDYRDCRPEYGCRRAKRKGTRGDATVCVY